MSIISAVCEQAIGQQELELLYELLGEYVLPREYLIVQGADAGQLDLAAKNLLETCDLATSEINPAWACEQAKYKYRAVATKLLADTGYGRPFYDQFMEQFMEPFVDSPQGVRLPGFDNATCTFDWHVFACFCNASATLFDNSLDSGTDLLSPFLAVVKQAGFTPTNACPDRVMTDPVYDLIAQYTPNASGGGSTPEPLPPGPEPPPPTPGPGPGPEPINVEEDHEGPPWWVWAGLVVGGTALLWPVVKGKSTTPP